MGLTCSARRAFREAGSKITSDKNAAPETIRKNVNEAAPISPSASANRHSTEFDAKASSVTTVRRKVREDNAWSME